MVIFAASLGSQGRPIAAPAGRTSVDGTVVVKVELVGGGVEVVVSVGVAAFGALSDVLPAELG